MVVCTSNRLWITKRTKDTSLSYFHSTHSGIMRKIVKSIHPSHHVMSMTHGDFHSNSNQHELCHEPTISWSSVQRSAHMGNT